MKIAKMSAELIDKIVRQIYDAVPAEFQYSWKALMEN